MSERKIQFFEGEYYHIYNHGVEERCLVFDTEDSNRFLFSLTAFNTIEPIGSIFEQSFRKVKISKKLVDIVAYCLNPNHFHLLLSPLTDRGIERYLHRLCTGYAKYFNNRYDRKGVLFRGKYRARHIVENDDLLYNSVYVSRNNEVHQLGSKASKLVRSSWLEYSGKMETKDEICKKGIILEQFKSLSGYIMYADEALSIMQENKEGETKRENQKPFQLGSKASK